MVQFGKFTEAEIISRIISREKALYEMIVRRFNPYLTLHKIQLICETD